MLHQVVHKRWAFKVASAVDVQLTENQCSFEAGLVIGQRRGGTRIFPFSSQQSFCSLNYLFPIFTCVLFHNLVSHLLDSVGMSCGKGSPREGIPSCLFADFRDGVVCLLERIFVAVELDVVADRPLHTLVVRRLHTIIREGCLKHGVECCIDPVVDTCHGEPCSSDQDKCVITVKFDQFAQVKLPLHSKNCSAPCLALLVLLPFFGSAFCCSAVHGIQHVVPLNRCSIVRCIFVSLYLPLSI